MGRGKYHPPEQLDAPTRLEYVNEVTTPTERAVRQFERFVREWTAPAISGHLFEHAVDGMRRAIRSIAPVAEVRQVIGHAVFKLELDDRYDLAHVCVSPVFGALKQAENSCKGFNERKDGHFVICEVRQLHIGEKR